jgi:uncharacterized membrane protein
MSHHGLFLLTVATALGCGLVGGVVTWTRWNHLRAIAAIASAAMLSFTL